MESGLTQTTLDLVRQFGYLAVFVFLFLETSMVFPLLPSEVVVPFAAGVLVTGPAGVVLFGAASAGGAVVGGVFAYYVFGGGSNRIADRIPDRFVDDDDLDRSRTVFQEYGEGSVLWGRLLPVVRSVISIPAGVARMDMAKFVVYTAVGAFVFNGAVAAVVYWGKQQSLYKAVASYAISNPLQGALVATLVVVFTLVVWKADLSGVVGRDVERGQ